MKDVYVGALNRLLQLEKDIGKLEPPEVMGYKSRLGRRVLSRAIFGLYEEFCCIGEKEEARNTITNYIQGNKTLVHS